MNSKIMTTEQNPFSKATGYLWIPGFKELDPFYSVSSAFYLKTDSQFIKYNNVYNFNIYNTNNQCHKKMSLKL